MKSRIIFIPDFMLVLKELSLIDNLSMSDIHEKTKITYSHLHRMKNDFINEGWIVIKKVGVVHHINFTEKGKLIIVTMGEFFKSIGITDDNLYQYRRRQRDLRKNKVIVEEVKDDGTN